MSQLFDIRRRFLFENASVRGEMVRLGESWRHLLATHPYPKSVRNLLGEFLTSTVLLSATLKYHGILTAQLQSPGPLNLLVTECTSDNTFRGMAQYQEQAATQQKSQLLQQGILALTIDPLKGERYQGIVDIRSGHVAHAIEDYMLRSQQIETRIWLAVNADTAAGLLLQKLPVTDDTVLTDLHEPEDLWDKLIKFTDTVKSEELFTEDFQTLIRHLYPEDDVRLFESIPVHFRCTCSVDKVKNMLRMLGKDETTSILEEKGQVGVSCEFCNKRYELDKVDIEELFATEIATQRSKTKH